MSDANTREPSPLIIRRGGSAELEAPKGGVWKIAYADFMTAMMAFFLVMWLINATSETTKTGVANYFNPIKLADGNQLPRKGLHDPADEDFQPADPAEGEASEAAGENSGEHGAKSEQAEAEAGDSSERKARYSEEALFRDPYAVLAAIAAEAEGTSPLVTPGGGAETGAFGDGERVGDASYGDPFDPAAWYVHKEAAPPESPSAAVLGQGEAVARDVAAPLPQDWADEAGGEFADDARAPAPEETARTGTIEGQQEGQAGAEGTGADAAAASPLQERLTEALGAASRRTPSVTIEDADGGVLISLADQVEFGMFAIGSAEPLPETIAVMEKIAGVLKDIPGRVIIRGHTDGRPFRSAAYDNWRLSSARAHMAYHMLVRGGLDDTRVERIEGYADRDLKLPDDPDAAENRRIDILVQEVQS